MAVGTPSHREVATTLTSVEGTLVSQAIAASTNTDIVGVFVKASGTAPECSLVSVALSSGDATLRWEVRGKKDATYPVTVTVTEVSTA